MGYPEGLNVPANFNPLNGRVNYIPPDLKTGQIQNWHVTVQRELGANFVVDVAYVANKSEHLMVLGDFNQARPNANGENLTLQARRPIQGYQFIQSAFDGGKGDYRAMQVKVERRYQQGFYFLNSFTWSRTRDNASGHLETANGDNSRVNFANVDAEFGTSGYDQPLNNVTTAVWECRSAAALVWRLARHRGQHDDQRPAGEPELLAGRGLPGQHRRRPIARTSSARSTRTTRRPRSGSIRPTSWCRPIRRSRSATRRETWRAVPRSTRWISACTRICASAAAAACSSGWKRSTS